MTMTSRAITWLALALLLALFLPAPPPSR